MKTIFPFLLCSLLQSATTTLSTKDSSLTNFSQVPGPKNPDINILLRSFIRDVIANKLSDTELENKYFCTQMLHRTDEYGEKARAAAAFWLSDIRQQAEKQQVNVDELTFTAYSDLPDETMKIMGGTQDAYVARYKGTSFRYFQLAGNKIGSLLLVSQGDRGFFFTLCE